MTLDEAQSEMRVIYRRGSIGQLVTGLVWLGSAALATAVGQRLAIIALLLGGMVIFPVTQIVLRLGGGRASPSPQNPLSRFSLQSVVAMAALYPLVYVAALHNLNSVIGPYPIAAYRGWIGGIVSVDGRHQSRLSQPSSAVYYVATLVLQLIPYTLAGGAGVALGVSAWRARADASVPKWLTFPRTAVLDVARIYVLVVPLFFIASLWEFFA